MFVAIFFCLFVLFPDDKIHIDPTEFTFSQHALEHWSISVADERIATDTAGEISQKQRHPKTERLEP